MQLRPLMVAGLGAVAAAAPSPLLLASPPLDPQPPSCDDVPALPALQSLGDAAAAAFCQRVAPVPTQTARRTVTVSETATVTASAAARTTETRVVDGPTDLSTETITETATITQPATATAYTTSTVTVTVIGRTPGGPPGGVDGSSGGQGNAGTVAPGRRKKKRGDKCAAKPKSSSSSMSNISSSSSSSAATTISSAATSTASSSPADVLDGFPADAVAAACACLTGPAPTTTQTITVSATVATASQTVTTGTETRATTTTAPGLTSVSTARATARTTTTTQTVATVTSADPAAPAATTSVLGPVTFAYVRSYRDYCTPYWVVDQPGGVPATPDAAAQPATFEYAFQQCAARCLANPACGEIYVNYPDPIDPRYGANCYLGYPRGDPLYGWRDDPASIRCGQFAYQYGVWYTKPESPSP